MSKKIQYNAEYDYMIDYCRKELYLTVRFDMSPNPDINNPKLQPYIFTPIGLGPLLSQLKDLDEGDDTENPPTVPISRNLSICNYQDGWQRWIPAGNCSFVKTVLNFSKNGDCGLKFTLAFNPTQTRANGGNARQSDTINSLHINLGEIHQNSHKNGCQSSENCIKICDTISSLYNQFSNSNDLSMVQEGEESIIALELATHDDGVTKYIKFISDLNNLQDEYNSWNADYLDYVSNKIDEINEHIKSLEEYYADLEPPQPEALAQEVYDYIWEGVYTWNQALISMLAGHSSVARYLIENFPSEGWSNPQYSPGSENYMDNLTLFNPGDGTKAGEYMDVSALFQVNIRDYIPSSLIIKLNGAHTLVENSVIALNNYWNYCDTDSVGNLAMSGDIDLKQGLGYITDELKGKCTLFAFPSEMSDNDNTIPCISFSGAESSWSPEGFVGLKSPCEEEQ